MPPSLAGKAWHPAAGRRYPGLNPGHSFFKRFVEGASQNKKNLGESLVRLAQLMLDFGDWSFKGRDLLDFEVVSTGVEQLPETTRFSVQGFIAVLTSEVSGRQITCQSERTSPDTVVFRGKLQQ
jgi:hypothetical protein